MDKKMKYPAGFRFDSDLDLFKISIDYTKKLLDDSELLIVYGFIKNIGIKWLISEDDYKIKYQKLDWKEYNDILQSEILTILEQNYNEPLEIESGLLQYLKEEKVDEKDIDEICHLKLEKRKYAYEKLYSIRDHNRFSLKQDTISYKMSEVSYDFGKTLDAEEPSAFANLRFKTDDVLVDMNLPKQLLNIINSNKSKEISFICDKYDIDYLIEELKNIQKRL